MITPSIPVSPRLESKLEQAIVPNPLMVSAHIAIAEVVTCMSAARTACALLEKDGAETDFLQADARASCALIMEGTQLVGILTEQDVVHLSANWQSFTDRSIAEVMTSGVVTLQQSEFTDILVALQLLKQHRIRHLPILDAQGQVIGLLTQGTLLQTLNPIEVCKLVEELEQKVSRLEAENKELLQHGTLQQSEATTRAILQGIPDLLIRMSSQGEYQEVLSGGSVHVLLPPEDIARPSVRDVLSNELVTQRLHYTALALASGQLQIYEQQVEIDGKRYDEEVRITPLNQDEVLVIVRDITDRKQTEAAFQSLVAGAAAIAGENFFTELVQYIAEFLQVPCVVVATLAEERLYSAAFWLEGQVQSNINYSIENTPCHLTVTLGEHIFISGVQQQFPTDQRLKALDAETYAGIALTNTQGAAIGCLYIIDNKPMAQPQLVIPMLRVFAARASAELERQAAINALKQLNQELENRIEQRTIELRQSEERFRQIFEQSPVGIAISDLEGRLTRVNSSLVQIIGCSKSELLQRSIQDIFSVDGQQSIQRLQQLLEQTLSVVTFESQLVSERSETLWVNVTSALIFNAFGRPSTIVHLIEDVSERKQTEAKLLGLTSLQQAILNSTDYSIISTDPAGIIQTFNMAAQRMLGYTAEEVVGKSTPEQIHDRAEVQQRAIAFSEELGSPIEPGFEVFVTKARQGISDEEEWTYIRKDGSCFPVLLSVTALRDRQGQISGFLGIAKDITQQKQAEEELRRTLKELSDFKYALDEAAIVAVTNADGTITYANDRFCEISQYSREELIGNTHRLVNSGYHSKQFFAEMWQTISNGKTWRGEIQNRSKDGNCYWVDSTIIPFLNSQGQSVQYLAIRTDITARKWAEFNAKSLKKRLQFLLSSSPAVIFTCKPSSDYSTTSISENVRTLLGYEPIDFLQDSGFWINHIHPEDTSKIRSEVPTLFKQGHHVHEYRFLHKDGTYRWMRNEMRLIRSLKGYPIEIIGYFADISDRKQMELELQELTLSLQNAMEGISRLDKQGRYLSLNRAYANLCGYEPEELVGLPWQTTVHSEDIPRMETAYQTMLDRGKVEAEARGIRKDGSLFYKQVTLIPALNREGEFNGHYCFLKDISDRKATEEALKRQLETIEAAIDGIAILKGDIYTHLNKAHLTLFGYEKPEELIGKIWQELYSPAEIDRFQREVFPVLAQQQSWQGEAIATRKDGSTFIEGLSLTFTEQGELICVCRDITAQKAAGEQLRQANEQLLLANAELAHATRLKDEFLANMSHELRTPLNAILGMAEGLQEGVFGHINDRQKHAIETVDRSGKHLLELINDILDLSKTESGKLELQIAPVSISYLCESSLTFVRQQAIQKNIQLSSQVPQQLPFIEVDERRIRQVLINLLSNAVKFTPTGNRITLKVHIEPQQDQTFLVFSVIDTGIGISQENIDKLFQPFVQIDSRLNRQYAGTGLGLALVRRLTELHNGTVAVSSVLGQGSCFTVRLPYVCEFKAGSVPPLQPQQLGALALGNSQHDAITTSNTSIQTKPSPLILLAEGSEANVVTISSYLKARGYRLLLAKTGEEAVNLTKTQNPDLILMDIQMPKVNGLEAIRQIRADQQFAQIPIIALTALAMQSDRAKCIAAGANDYCSKPVKLKPLVDMIQNLLEKL